MKTRIISGVIAALIGIGIVCVFTTPVLPVIVVALAVLAGWEIMSVAGVKSNLVRIPASVFAAALPLYISEKDKIPFELPVGAIISLYVIIMLIFMLKTNKQTKFEQLAITLYGSIFVPYAFSGAFTIRDVYVTYPGTYTKADATFLFLFALLCAFLSDTFAYFVGSKFGKHKLAPVISPKKSVEGAIGGVVLSTAFNVGLFAGVRHWIFHGETAITFTFIIIMSVVLSVISMIGDLSASLLKRNFGVKDFGKLIPGHGGIMDRFDSCIFVLAVLGAALKFVNM